MDYDVRNPNQKIRRHEIKEQKKFDIYEKEKLFYGTKKGIEERKKSNKECE